MVTHATGLFQGSESNVGFCNHSIRVSTGAPRLQCRFPTTATVTSLKSLQNNRGRGLTTGLRCAPTPITPFLVPVIEEGEATPPIKKTGPHRAAFFDVDGTIVKSNVVSAFITWRMAELDFISRCLWIPTLPARIIVYLILDRIDRSLFNRVFYRSYAGRRVSMKENVAALVYERYLKPNTFPGAVERIQALKRDGYRIVLITGSLDFLVAPLAAVVGAGKEGDEVFAAKLKEADGKFTGELEGEAVSSGEKAKLVRQHAEEHGLYLPECQAYGDSFADLEMLMQVGYPFAVRPDSRLKAIASERGWKCIKWHVGEEKE